ncbi:MAG: acyl-CoA--6-aminopenicillanic acid acyl-transferase, partial [Firmicutes bacterium]|nr:acyl-CoA--6-aminopenicillanic acid acyl-transferase [Bacillota bacterium]
KITAEDIMEMLRDHAGYPQSICDHISMDFDMTNFSIIMDLTDNAIWLAPDCPCENEFERI